MTFSKSRRLAYARTGDICNDQEEGAETPGRGPRVFHGTRPPAATRKLYGRAHSHVLRRLAAEQIPGLADRMPLRASISSAPATPTLLEPEHAVSIEQSDRDTATGSAHKLAGDLDLVLDKAQHGYRHDQIKARVGVWQRTHVGNFLRRSSRIALARVFHPFRIDVDTTNGTVHRGAKRARKKSGATADVEQRISRPRLQVIEDKLGLALPDPPSARRVVPPIVGCCIHGDT